MTYITQTASRQNAPSYYLTVEGITTEEFSTHPVKGAVLPKVVCISSVGGTAQRLTPLQGRATVGEVRVRLADKSGKITSMLNAATAQVNRVFTLKGGYRDEPESEFQTLFVGELRGAEQVAPLVFELTIAARTRKLDDMLMKGVNAIRTRINANQGTTLLTCESVSGFSPGTYTLFSRTAAKHESVSIVSINVGANTMTTSAPIANSYFQNGGDVITNAPIVIGNLVNVLYALLRGVFSTSPSASSFPLRSVYGSPSGLSFADADLDLVAMAAARDAAYAEYDVAFLFDREVRARSFFEEQIYALGLYQTYTNTGKLGVRAFVPPGPDAASFPKIYKEHMLGFPRWRYRLLDHINRVLITGDRDFSNTIADQVLALVEDTADQAATREIGEFKIASTGLRTGLDGVALSAELAARVTRRWKAPPVEIEVPVAFTKRGLQPGDVALVSHPALPNVISGTVGLTDRVMEVIESNVLFDVGAVELTLLDSAFGRWGWIGAASMADYPAQSADERRYASWGNASNLVNAGTEAGFRVF